MSEKHLTESPWKVLVTKQGVKDIGLGKALAGYAKVDATKEPRPAIEALKEISELALKLKKTCASKADVVDHLDEVIKEVKKTIPTLEAKVKAGETAFKQKAAATPPEENENEEEEEEAAEFKKDLKKQMVSALAQVKMRAPGDPEQKKEPKPQLQFMAYVAAKASAVIVARKVGSATKQLLPDIAGVPSGGKFIKGECIFEKNSHTFVLDQVPGGLAKKLAKALAAETGAKYKVRVRSTDGSMELDSDTDLDPDAAAAAPSAPPAPDTAQGMTTFTARFKALQPDLLKLIATKTPQGAEAKQRATEAGALAGKKDFARANQLLDTVESLLKKGGAASAGPALVVWQQAKDAVDAQLVGLYSKLKKSGLPVLNEVANEIEGVLGSFRTGLVTALTEFDQAADAKKEQARAKALQMVTAYQASIPKDKLIIAADTNPFGVKVAIRQTLGGALANLSTRLKGG